MKDEHFDTELWLGGVLQQISGQMKHTLNDMYHALERIAPPDRRDEDPQLDMDAAAICRGYHRALRLAVNLSAAGELVGPSGLQLRNDDVVGLCRAVKRRVEEPAAMLGLELTFHSDQDSCIIALDQQKLERLLLNLLSNAFKFTPRGGRVSLEVCVKPRTVELRLRDTGCGIPDEQMESVFTAYQQPDRLIIPPRGMGLGLPICRRIAQEHGGSIFLTSRPGEGTTVVVSLPRKKGETSLSTVMIDIYGGFNEILVELSDVLPREAFSRKYLD